MKICLFGDARSIHVQRLARGLASRGLGVHIVCHKPQEVSGATVEPFRVPPPGPANLRGWHGRRVHYLRGFLRRFDVVNIQFLSDWGLTPEVMAGGRLIATAWGSDVVPPPGEAPPSADLTAARKSLLRCADAVTALGPSFGAVVARYADIDVGRVTVIPFGVDLDVFRPERRTEPEPSFHRVGFYKGFREVYGPTYLIRAIPMVLQAMPGTRFDLVGDGPQRDRCQALAAELGVASSIHWIPQQPHCKVPSWLATWDLTVIPSVCEAFGVAALESSAVGVPVVASRVGGLVDVVQHGKTGLLVEPESPEALATAMLALLADAPRRRRMGEAGHRWVRENFEWEHSLNQWESVYRRVADGSRVTV